MKKQNLVSLFENVLAVTQRAGVEISEIQKNVELSSEGENLAIDRVREKQHPC